jgi:putative SOS response-associated peptidase YedK
MCGRFTVKMTWTEIVALYKLTLDRPPHNFPSRYNVCPTDPIDVVTERGAQRDFVRMRAAEIVHNDHHRTKRFRCRGSRPHAGVAS